MTVRVADYWPFDLVKSPGKTRSFHYTDPTGAQAPFTSAFGAQASLTSAFGYDPTPNLLVYVDSDANGKWTDTWLLQVDAQGISEVSDWYPGGKKLYYKEPIRWGGMVAVPGTIHNSPVYDPFKSTPLTFGAGFQAVSFECITTMDGYTDVLQFCYAQSWNGKTPTGGRYWMARGVGPIALQWLGFNPDGS